jgi:cell division septation protein DedD
VLETIEQTVYLDTTNIRQTENQISVLSLTSYNKPQMITSINKEASYIKTQILFNVVTRKYSTIGNLYYDKELKIIGETSLPGFSTNNENFAQPLENNKEMMATFNLAYRFINKTDPPPVEERTFKINNPNDNTAQQNMRLDSAIEVQRNPVVSSVSTNDQKLEQPATDKKEKLVGSRNEKDPSIKIVKNTVQPKATVESKSKGSNQTPSEYNSEAETNLKGTIFTDGSKYSFQVSSWRVKSKAESEVQRLKSEGHNAFVIEGIVKRNTWYRVRIGFFSSLEQTEAYMKNVK